MQITKKIETTIEVDANNPKKCLRSCRGIDKVVDAHNFCLIYGDYLTIQHKRCQQCIDDFGMRGDTL